MGWLNYNDTLEKVRNIRNQRNPVAFFEVSRFDKKGKLIETTTKEIRGRENIRIYKEQMKERQRFQK